MKTMSTAEVRDLLGISPEQIDEWERDTADGALHGESRGAVVTGRPLMLARRPDK